MRHHSFDQRLCKFAYPRVRGAKFPEIVDLVRPFTPLGITPEMIFDPGLPRSATFTHSLPPANLRQNVHDFHRCTRGFGSTVDFTFKTPRPRLVFVIKTEYDINYRHAVLYGDALQGISNGTTQVLCVIGFASQNHPARDDYVRLVLNRNFARDYWNLERPRHAMDQNRTVWRQRVELLCNVIYESIHVLRIKPARNDVERAFGLGDWRTRRCRFRHRLFRSAVGNPQSQQVSEFLLFCLQIFFVVRISF